MAFNALKNMQFCPMQTLYDITNHIFLDLFFGMALVSLGVAICLRGKS